MSEEKVILDPMCFYGDFPLSITNTGELIPCCYCDDPDTLNDPTFKKLLAVSNIKDYEHLEDIMNTKEWRKFAKRLTKHQGPPACINTCRRREDSEDIIRKDTWINPNDTTKTKTRRAGPQT